MYCIYTCTFHVVYKKGKFYKKERKKKKTHDNMIEHVSLVNYISHCLQKCLYV